MKLLLPALLLFSLLPALPAQNVPIDRAAATVVEVRLSREELKKLTGPIALYPDPMIALILPASTFPSDIVLAARFVAAGEAPALADEKPWDSSIRSLVHYPDVLTWMDENLEWTTQLGYAYLAQPEEVMDAIQEQRAQAQAVGNLVDTPEQRVVRDETYIRIVPANPEYIYVPYYDPVVVYYERPVYEPFYAPLLTFGYGCRSGSWLNFDLDWHRHRVYCGDWRGDWDYDRRHDRHDRYDHRGQTIYINNSLTNYQEWQGDSRRRRAPTRAFAENHDRQRSISRPLAFKDSPDRDNAARRSLPDRANESRIGDRGKMGDDGRSRERGQIGEGSKIDNRSRSGDDSKIGDRGKAGDVGRIGDDRNAGDHSKFGDRGKTGDDRKPDGRGKDHLVMPRNAAPVITGNGRSDKDKLNDNLKGPGRGDIKPDMRGGTSGRPEVKGKGIPSVGRPAPLITGNGRTDKDKQNGNLKGPGRGETRPDMRGGPSGRPEVNGKGIPSVGRSAPVITGNGRPDKANSAGNNARNDDKIKATTPKPRMDVGRVASSASKVNTPDRTPRIAPKPGQGPPKISSAPSVRQNSPAPRSAPSVRKSAPQPQVSAAPVRKSPPKSVAAPSERKSSPKPGASVAPHRSPPKHVASAPGKSAPKHIASAPSKSSSKPSAVQRSVAKPQAHSAPSKGGGGKKPADQDDSKKKKKK